MLPPPAARCLAAGQEYAEAFDGVTILFADICSYTTISSELTPRQVVALLSGLYDRFDKLCEQHGMYKVEIVGDCWMAASGAFPRFAPHEAALRAARQALAMVQVAEAYTTEDGRHVQIRVGLASGPVFASVISHKMAHVTLIGDTTNVAARMESSSKPMHIHVAESTAALLHPALSLQPSGLSPQPSVLNTSLHDLQSQASIPPGLTSTVSYDIPAASASSFLEAAPHSQRVNSSKSNVQVCVNIDTDIAEVAKQHLAVPHETSEQADEMLVGSRVEVADPDTGCTLYLEARGAQNIKGKGLMNTFWLSSTPSMQVASGVHVASQRAKKASD
ncbi:nucleotide cyclase [Haematococcus lacustris]